MPVAGNPDVLYLGKELLVVNNVAEELEKAHQERFDFIAIPLAVRREYNVRNDTANDNKSSHSTTMAGGGTFCSPVDTQDIEGILLRLSEKYSLCPSTKSDLVLESKKWTSNIVGVISPWIDPDFISNNEIMAETKLEAIAAATSTTSSTPMCSTTVTNAEIATFPQMTDDGGVCNRMNEATRRLFQKAFERELSWASHLSVFATICPIPNPRNCVNYCRILRAFLGTSTHTSVWIRIPLSYKRLSISSSTSIPEMDNDAEVDGWNIWKQVCFLCDHPTQLGVAIEMTDFPNTPFCTDRWIAEPVKAVVIPTNLFITNPKGCPVLPKRHKEMLLRFFSHNVQIILRQDNYASETQLHDFGVTNCTLHSVHNHTLDRPMTVYNIDSCCKDSSVANCYVNYVAKLFQSLPPCSDVECFEYPYRDYLQTPLQPLQDNLESQTYETFERDSAKYVLYEKAITAYLTDKLQSILMKRKPIQNYVITHKKDEEINNGNIDITNVGDCKKESLQKDLMEHQSAVGDDKYSNLSEGKLDLDNEGIGSQIFKPVIMVVGAGRGPLVHAVLQGLDRSGIVDYELLAVEKNENAVITLQARVSTDKHQGWRRVNVIGCDMRKATYLKKHSADLIVSELLGSFSDNELSPECIDGVQKLLKPDGLFIPISYTSFLAPISSYKLWNEVRNCGDYKSFEVAYVVKPHSVFYLSREGPLPCFTFRHPNPLLNFSNGVGNIPSEISCDFPITSKCVDYTTYKSVDFEDNSAIKSSSFNNNHGIVSHTGRELDNDVDTLNSLLYSDHNRRFRNLTFTAKCCSVLHGFMGYFSSNLYGEVHMSIVPGNKSEGMFSWFPLFLPLNTPIFVNEGDIINVHIWRCDDSRKVWYEWCLTSPQMTAIHNTGGRSSYMEK